MKRALLTLALVLASIAPSFAQQLTVFVPSDATVNAGHVAWANDGCIYQFNGMEWVRGALCRRMVAGGPAPVYEVFNMRTGKFECRMSESSSWIEEFDYANPAMRGMRFRYPTYDWVKFGKLGPNNTYLFENGLWRKVLEIQEEAELARIREAERNLTPEQREANAAARAAAAAAEARMGWIALGAKPTIRVW